MFYSKWTSEKDLKKYLTEVEIGSEMQKDVKNVIRRK